MTSNISRSADVTQKQTSRPFNKSQFIWFLLHLITLCLTILYALYSLFLFPSSSSMSQTLFTLSTFSVASLFAIVLFKSYSYEKITKILVSRPLSLLRNSNFLYLFLVALYRTQFSNIFAYVSVALYPFAIYSMFHCIGYVATEFHWLFPAPIISFLKKFHSKFCQNSLNLAANTELYILLQIIFVNLRNWFILKDSYLSGIWVFFCYLMFLKLRYDESPQMKSIVSMYDYQISMFLNTKMPPWVFRIWCNFRFRMIQLLSLIRVWHHLRQPRNSMIFYKFWKKI